MPPRFPLPDLSAFLLLGLAFGPLACAGADDPALVEAPDLTEPESGGTVTGSVVYATGGTSGGGSELGGDIKSYFDDVEREPLALTGSIFGPGVELGAAPGAAGGAGLFPVSGLGAGDLTVLLLFDGSTSMEELWEGRPRWEVASDAFLAGLSGQESLVTIGALYFPQGSECEVAPLSDARQVQLQAGSEFAAHWRAHPEDRRPSGGTPLGPAFEQAELVLDEAERFGLLGPGRRFRVVVATDGKPNCGTSEDRVVYLASKWVERGAEVHVIGLPGSAEASSFLERLAFAGGSGAAQTPGSAEEAEEDFALVVR